MGYVVTNTFATQSGNVPASQLDQNFTDCLAGINNAFLSGTLAARPAASNANGRYYYATDVQILYRDNGSAWVQVAASALPGANIAALTACSNLKIKPSDPGNLAGGQGGDTGTAGVYTAVGGGAFYNLFDGTVNHGFLISSPSPFYAFNALISAAAAPTAVTYYFWNGSNWTSFVPSSAATWSALGYTQARWTAGLVTGWAVGGTGTNVPQTAYNILVIQTTGTTTVTGRCSLATSQDVTADEVIVADGSANKYRIGSLSVVLNALVNGANGLDTGALAASTYYYTWAIYNPTSLTAASLLSLSSTAPTMPAGYTAKMLLGGYRTDANSLLLPWSQTKGIVIVGAVIKDVTQQTPTTATPVTLTVPPIAVNWIGGFGNPQAAVSVQAHDAPFVYSTSAPNCQVAVYLSAVAADFLGARIRLSAAQTIYWANGGAGNTDVLTLGYEMPGNIQ